VEAAVFWLVAISVIELVARPTSQTPEVAVYAAVVLGAVGLVLAYFCWKLESWVFIAAIILSIFLVLVAFPESPGNEATPYGAFIDAMLITSVLWIAFLSYRSFREVRVKLRPRS
jgi:hypothetical protein